MKVWVTRDVGSPGHCDIRYAHNRPTRFGETWDDYGSRIYVSHKILKEALGNLPRKGTCKQYDLTLTPVED